jgi:hypothetical protein
MVVANRARLKGLTNSSASPHNTYNHLFDGLLIEALQTLVYEKQPVWDFHGLEHEPVEPFKMRVII